MAEQETNAPAGADAAQTADTTGAETPNSGAQQAADKTFTQADVDRIIAERLTKERARQEAAAAKARDDAAQEAAVKQGEFKELYEKTAAQLQAAEARAKALEHSALQREVAAKVGLPAAWADRLRGETPEDLEADAKALLQSMPKPAAPNLNNAPGGGSSPATGGGLTYHVDKQELAARLGVDAKYLP